MMEGGEIKMRIEFFPRVTRLLENKEAKLKLNYLSKSWTVPTIAVRPPYYKDPVYEPYYPNI